MLPAAVSLRKQGANKGAVTSFLISTPESGVDSISITYALLDPILTIARPLVAFFTATLAGVVQNIIDYNHSNATATIQPDLTCPVDGCCDGIHCDPALHRRHHTMLEKLTAGIRYAFLDFWRDLVGWFFIGILLAGCITALIPDDVFSTYLGSGLPAMFFMLAIGIPLYICATASTPIAAALILKGVSPGAALVFLLAGPATNVASMTVLAGVMGKRATVIYLTAIAVSAVVFGLLVDQVYAILGISAQAIVGQASESIPVWLEMGAVLLLILLSIGPLIRKIKAKLPVKTKENPVDKEEMPQTTQSCGPT